MLPLLEKPAIQYIVEEGVRSNLKTFIVVTGKNKSVIEDHFDPYPELESYLAARKKDDLLEGINKLINRWILRIHLFSQDLGKIRYGRRRGALGRRRCQLIGYRLCYIHHVCHKNLLGRSRLGPQPLVRQRPCRYAHDH